MIILWIISVALLFVGFIIAITNTGIPIVWYYNKWFRKRTIYLGSRLPLMGAPFLFLGTLFLPVEYPFNRFVMASIVACLDISIIDTPLFWLIWLLRGRPKLDTYQEQTDQSES